jgi:hypothetical protein
MLLASLFMFCAILHVMKSDREIEILFRRLRLYDQLERRAEGLVHAIQRVMRQRYGDARTIALVRRKGRQSGMNRRARRTAPASHA